MTTNGNGQRVVGPWSLGQATLVLGFIATLFTLSGVLIGGGQDYGALAQNVREHERRINGQGTRDDRQDEHMEAIDAVIVGMREDLAAIKGQLNFLVRQAREGRR